MLTFADNFDDWAGLKLNEYIRTASLETKSDED